MRYGLATLPTPQLPARLLLYRQLAAACAAAGTAALLLSGGVLLGRRLAGAPARPLGPLWLLLAAVLLTCACLAVHALWQRVGLARRGRLLAAVAVSAACLAIALTLSLPGSPRVPLALLWTLVVFSQGLALIVATRGWPARLGRGSSRRPATVARTPAPRAVALEQAPATDPDEAPLGLPPGATQQLTRRHDLRGNETIYGSLRETFAPRQRTASLHVAFCPPLAGLPELAVEQLDGPEAAVKIGELQPYGARLDLRLKRAADRPVDVVLDISVVAGSQEG